MITPRLQQVLCFLSLVLLVLPGMAQRNTFSSVISLKEPVSQFPLSTFPQKNEFVELDREPIPLNYVKLTEKIQYPVEAAQAGIEGIVQVRFFVDEYGNYVRHQYVGGHFLLAQAVEKHIQQMDFSPARINGRNASAWVSIPFYFRIR